MSERTPFFGPLSWFFSQANSSEANWTYLQYGPFKTLSEYSGWVEAYSKMADPVFFTVLSNKTSKPIGVLSLMRIDTQNGAIEVSLTTEQKRNSDGKRWSPWLREFYFFFSFTFISFNWFFFSEVGGVNFSPLLQRTPGATEAVYLLMKYCFDLGLFPLFLFFLVFFSFPNILIEK